MGVHKAGFECSTMKTWMVVDSSWIKGLSVAYFFKKGDSLKMNKIMIHDEIPLFILDNNTD